MKAPRVTSVASERLVASLGDTAASEWLADAHDAPPERELTRSRTTDTSLIATPSGGAVVRKRWRWPGLEERLKGLGRTTAFARTPAEREWEALGRTYGASDLRFHPAPLAVRVERRGGFAVRAMLLLEEVPGCVDLATFLRDEDDRERRRRVLHDLATRTRAMHADGVADGDLHPRNLLVERDALRVWKVDCARQRRRAAPLTGRHADHDLACIDVGLARFATRAERLRALRVYLDVGAGAPATRRRAAAILALRARLDATEASRLPARRPPQ